MGIFSTTVRALTLVDDFDMIMNIVHPSGVICFDIIHSSCHRLDLLWKITKCDGGILIPGASSELGFEDRKVLLG